MNQPKFTACSSLISLLFLANASSLCAAVTPLAHYNLKGKGGIRDFLAAEKIVDKTGKSPALERQGSPKVITDSPAHRRVEYDSSVKFEAADQCYSMPKNLVGGDNFIIETWVYAMEANAPGFHAALANGDGRSGFLLSQKDDHWSLLVGGVGDYPLGKVEPRKWTHLALVKSGGEVSGWLNGVKVRDRLPKIGGGFANFSIGATRPGMEPFNGWVAEVRYSSFKPGEFDPLADFLLDNPKIKARHDLNLAKKQGYIKAIASAPGVRQVKKLDEKPYTKDWLITPPKTPASIQVRPNKDGTSAQLMLSNGLVSRTFQIIDNNIGCISLRRSDKGIEFLRAIKPEVRVRIDDGTWTEIGGLTGAADKGFITEKWLPELTSKPGAFKLAGITVGGTVKPYEWKPKYNSEQRPWPAPGQRLTMHFTAPEGAAGLLGELAVDVHYEIYQGIPVIMKTFTLHNNGGKEVVVTQFEGEHLAVQPTNSRMMHVESDYAFACANFHEGDSSLGMHMNGSPELLAYAFGGGTTRLIRDPDWASMATNNPAEDLFLDDPQNALLLSRPSTGPNWTVKEGGRFDAFRTFEILNDTTERERYHLAQRRFYKTLAPQTTEHMLEAHAATLGGSTRDMKVLGPLMDQMKEIGFEVLAAPTWPGNYSHADISEENTASMKLITEYAKSRGIIVGAYELMIASRDRGPTNNCIHPITGVPGSVFGQSGCGGSEWGQMYSTNMWKMFDKTGMMSFKPDGPYHGDSCASTKHPGHKGLADSQWAQWKWQCEILKEGQRRNLYLNLPDYYFLNGQSNTGMGYREAVDFIDITLQTLLYRQYIFDGTFHKTASMGWVNLNTEFLRGGPEKDLERYELFYFTLLSSGANVGVRGFSLYDGPKSKAMLQKWTNWFKKYRKIVSGDIIHLRRPDGRDIDYYMHVAPDNKEKGMLLVFNPLPREVTRKIKVPLYYTGLSSTAAIREQEGRSTKKTLNRDYSVDLEVTIPANGHSWFVIE